MQDSGLVQSRREGKRTFYKLNPEVNDSSKEFIQLAVRGAKELAEHAGDQINLKRILNRRREQAELYFNQVAGRFDRVYGPGRSWQAIESTYKMRFMTPSNSASSSANLTWPDLPWCGNRSHHM